MQVAVNVQQWESGHRADRRMDVILSVTWFTALCVHWVCYTPETCAHLNSSDRSGHISANIYWVSSWPDEEDEPKTRLRNCRWIQNSEEIWNLLLIFSGSRIHLLLSSSSSSLACCLSSLVFRSDWTDILLFLYSYIFSPSFLKNWRTISFDSSSSSALKCLSVL